MKTATVSRTRARLSVILCIITIFARFGMAQNDTLQLYYRYSQIAPADSTLANIDRWVKRLNGRHVNLDLVAYYDKPEFKKFAVSRLEEIFLVLNRKARALITIRSSAPKKGKAALRSRLDIVYAFTDGQPAPAKEPAITLAGKAGGGNKTADPKPKEKSSMLSGEQHHLVKLNAMQLGVLNISAQYEFSFRKKLSVALGISCLVPRRINRFVNVFSAETQERAQGKEIGFINPVLSGWAITPELRIYPFASDERQAPQGFYVAPYFRYAKFSMVSIYNEYYDGVSYRLNFTSRYNCVSGGVMIGKQWLMGKRKRVSLDWWIFGLGGGTIKPGMEASATNINMSKSVQADVKKEVEGALVGLEKVGFEKPKVETSSNSFSVSLSRVPFVTARGLGLCIGFVF